LIPDALELEMMYIDKVKWKMLESFSGKALEEDKKCNSMFHA
jgi:hypothetical protein